MACGRGSLPSPAFTGLFTLPPGGVGLGALRAGPGFSVLVAHVNPLTRVLPQGFLFSGSRVGQEYCYFVKPPLPQGTVICARPGEEPWFA